MPVRRGAAVRLIIVLGNFPAALGLIAIKVWPQADVFGILKEVEWRLNQWQDSPFHSLLTAKRNVGNAAPVAYLVKEGTDKADVLQALWSSSFCERSRRPERWRLASHTAMFTVLNAALLRSLPYQSPDRVLMLRSQCGRAP